MEIGAAFTFPGDDPRWARKLLIGGGLVLLGCVALPTLVGGLVVAALVLGYLARLTRNVSAGAPRPLPEWADWGGLLREGAGALAVALVALAPVVGLSLALLAGGLLLASRGDGGAAGLGGAALLAGYCCVPPPGPLAFLLLPIPLARHAATGWVGAALHPGACLATLRAHARTYLLVALLTAVVTQGIGALGLLALGVGLPFTLFYALLVNHHLYGQAHRLARGSPPARSRP